MKKFLSAITAIFLAMLLPACGTISSQQVAARDVDTGLERSLLSYGMVKKLLVPGQTNQNDVIKAFGAPNNMTRQANGAEMWVYDQVRTEIASTVTTVRQGLTVGVGGVGRDAVLGIADSFLT